MGHRKVLLPIRLTQGQFIYLLLLNGTVECKSMEDGKVVVININGATEHKKFGLPGTEDGSNHFFKTYVQYRGRLFQGTATVNSSNQGQTYQGGVAFDVYPPGHMAE